MLARPKMSAQGSGAGNSDFEALLPSAQGFKPLG